MTTSKSTAKIFHLAHRKRAHFKSLACSHEDRARALASKPLGALAKRKMRAHLALALEYRSDEPDFKKIDRLIELIDSLRFVHPNA